MLLFALDCFLFATNAGYPSLEISNHRVPSPEDQDHIKTAKACIRDCHVEQLITESKFIRSDSLHELVKVF